jgi:hypothetical protein
LGFRRAPQLMQSYKNMLDAVKEGADWQEVAKLVVRD